VAHCRKSDEFHQSSFVAKKYRSDDIRQTDANPSYSSLSLSNTTRHLKDTNAITLKWQNVRLVFSILEFSYSYSHFYMSHKLQLAFQPMKALLHFLLSV
jgi:hypothetical protein